MRTFYGNVLYFDWVVVTWVCITIKVHRTEPLNSVHFIECKLFRNLKQGTEPYSTPYSTSTY